MKQDLNKKSKYLSLLLRHKPEQAELTMDKNGWVTISQLINNAKFSKSELLEIVKSDNKGRYELSFDSLRIRALQGHSINIDLELKSLIPPNILYHGTKWDYLPSIKKNGLIKGKRQYVHLSDNIETAINVGSRRKGSVVILSINTEKMINDEFKFYKSKNNVWLTDTVPFEYIQIIPLN